MSQFEQVTEVELTEDELTEEFGAVLTGVSYYAPSV